MSSLDICHTPLVTLFEERELRTFVEPGMFGLVVVRETRLDLLPFWLKALLVVGTLIVCVKFTIPVLDRVCALL